MKMTKRNENKFTGMFQKVSTLAILLAAFVCALVPGALSAGELIVGGTFETGSFTSEWVHSGGNNNGGTNDSWADHMVALDLPYAGNYSALLGFKYTTQRRNRHGFMYHDVTIPANVSAASLFFRFRQQGYDGVNYDPFIVEVRDLSDNVLATVVNFSFDEWNNQFKDSGWIGPGGFDMSPWAGQTVRIHFRQENTYDNLFETWTFIDDVSLIYSKYVDLIVDGNGDDLFADPGTGGGGSSSSSGEAGETVSYLIDVENESLDVDSYTLSVSLPAGWIAVLNYGGTDYPLPWTTPSIPSGASIQATVSLTIPAGESVAGYTTILDAVSTSFGLRFDSVSLVTNVVPSDYLTDLAIDANGFGVIDPDGGGGISFLQSGVGATVEYDVELMNSGIVTDSFRVWFSPETPLTAEIVYGAATYTGMFTTAALSPGGTASFTLRTIIPLSMSGGDYETLVYASSISDTLRKDGVTAVTRVIAPKVDIVIAGSGDDIIDLTGAGLGGSSTISGQQSNTVIFPIILQNEGSIPDSFTLDWTQPTGGWSAVINDGTTDHAFPWTTPELGVSSQVNYTLAVTIPGNAAFNTFVSILDAVSMTDSRISESVTAGISVASGNETDLMIDGNGADTYGPLGTGLGGSSLALANPGDTINFLVTVENEGGANTFDIEWNTPAGWTVLFDGGLSPTNCSAGDFILQVIVPLTCTGGTFDIIVDGMKSNKRYFVDSVLGRVVVSYQYLVDALIDGNGDDIFGTPGLGDGGSSLQATIGGRTIVFTVELQNESGDPEAYTLNWNSVPGWMALLAGNSSPWTTPVIAGGTSGLYSFQVTIPESALPSDYAYIIDVISTVDPTNVESIIANVHIDPPPQVDLVIDGDGALVTAPAGSGGGGTAMIFGSPATMVTAILEVFNRGGAPDSFEVTWNDPAGWPVGSVMIFDGLVDHASPFETPVIDPGNSIAYTVRVSIPATAAARTNLILDGRALSRDLEDSVELEVITSAFIVGRVFDDADHDGVYDVGEPGWPGVNVTVTDPSTPYNMATGADGSYLFEIPAGLLRDVISTTPSGMISLSPDTVSAGVLAAGDTVFIDFADVMISVIAPSLVRNGPAGGFIDLPHMITAGTAGQASVGISLPAGWADVWYRDVNGDGLFDVGDVLLTSADLDLDPAVPGQDMVTVIVRIFVPATVPAGTTGMAVITLYQTLSGTAITTAASVTDQLTVLSSSSGILNLVKEVDLVTARPGDIVTYTIIFSNPGLDDVLEIVIIDPVSPAVELVPDAFGPGNDIEWVRSGISFYLTADPLDADEGMFDAGTSTLRVLLSRQAPFSLAPGEEGRVVYRVRVR
ncbi:MAG: DUF11 domain-containing protein [Bacteroidales bacterium]|nr:DUF11 domain-containing protein [Candidatus Latescibacterota bacterium]